MAAGKELFKLFGLIGMQGVEVVEKDLKKIDKQSRKVQKEIERMGRKVSDTGKLLTKAFTAPLAAIAGTVGILAVKTGQYADKLLDLEQVTGLTTQKLQEYEHVAREAGVSFEGFVGIISKFQGRMPQLIDGQGRAAEAMDDLGVSIKNSDGSIKDINNLFPEMLAKLHGIDDITQRNAIAQQLFGRTMADLAPILSLSSDKIAEVTAEAHDMGLILDKEAIDKANKFRISMEKLKARITGAGRELALGFIPIIRDDLMPLITGTVIPMFQKMADKVRAVFEWYGNLSDQTKRTVKGFILIAAAVGPVLIIVGKVIFFSKLLIPIFVALKTATISWAAAMKALNASMLAIPILITALVAIGWFWISQWDNISSQFSVLWAQIVLAVKKGANILLQSITDGVLKALELLDKVAAFIPGFDDKLKSARKSILLFKAALFKDLGKQQRLTNDLNDQATATKGLTETVKDATEKVKDLLGIKELSIKKTKKQIAAEKEQAKLAEEAAKKATQEADERLAHEKSIQQQINEMTLTKLELLELERIEAKRIAEEKGADTLAVAELFILKEQKLRDQIRKEEAAKDRKALKTRLNQASSLGNKLNNVLGQFSDNRLKRLDIEEKRKIESIQNSQMTEEQKEDAVQKIQEETEKKRRKLERERAIREKLAALFNIGINTASAIVEALPNIPLSLFVGGLGIASGIAVATAPLPFFDGAMVKGSDQGVNALVGEDNQDEVVFPLEKGVGLLADGLIERIGGAEVPAFGGTALAESAGPVSTVHLHIGTFIGDERGLKELERKLDTVRIAENQRKGF